MKVFVRAPIHQDAIVQLRADSRVRTITWDEPAVARWEEEADAVILRGTDITGDEIRRAAKLKVIGRHGAGVDAVDLEAARERGLIVMYAPFENSRSVAEMAVGLMLACARNMMEVNRMTREGQWKEGRKGKGCIELFGNSVGMVGCGRIGRIVAGILKNGFGMDVLAYDPLLPDAAWAELKGLVTPCKSLKELFAAAQYVSIHLPKTRDTLGMINADVFAAARKGLILVNTARGGVVDEKALYDALAGGTLRAAASDVFTTEPLDTASPLLTLPNFIATPHCAGATDDCLRRVATAIARETVAALFGQENPAYRYM